MSLQELPTPLLSGMYSHHGHNDSGHVIIFMWAKPETRVFSRSASVSASIWHVPRCRQRPVKLGNFRFCVLSSGLQRSADSKHFRPQFC